MRQRALILAVALLILTSGLVGCSDRQQAPNVTKGPPERLAPYITDRADWYCMDYTDFVMEMANMLKGSMEALSPSITQLATKSIAEGDPVPVVLVSPGGDRVVLAIDHIKGSLYLYEFTVAPGPDGYWGAKLNLVSKK